MKLLLRLYPADWRARYEEEFLAVLEQRSLSPFDVFDITLGALDARLRPAAVALSLEPRRFVPVQTRTGGFAAIAGGILVLLMLAIGFLLPDAGSIAAWVYPVAAVALLTALLGLSAVQGRRNPALVWTAVALPIAGLLLGLTGMVASGISGERPIVGSWSGWELWFMGTIGTVIGSVLFAAATVAVKVFSRAAALSLLAGSVTIVVIGLPVSMGLGGDSMGLLVPVAAIGVILFGLGWIWLGVAAAVVRAPQPADAG